MSDRTPTPPGDRRFHLRYSTDPVFLATCQDQGGNPEVQKMINDTVPYATGDAAKMRDTHRALRDQSNKANQLMWISIRDVETGKAISIEEIRLIAAIWNEADEENPT